MARLDYLLMASLTLRSPMLRFGFSAIRRRACRFGTNGLDWAAQFNWTATARNFRNLCAEPSKLSRNGEEHAIKHAKSKNYKHRRPMDARTARAFVTVAIAL